MKIVLLKGTYYCMSSIRIDDKEFYQNVVFQGIRHGSFVDRCMHKILRDIFRYAVNVRDEYELYYRDEYDSFSDFLFQKELLGRDIADTLGKNVSEQLYRLYLDLNDYNTDNLLLGYEDDYNELNRINRILEQIYEDKK